MKRQDQARYKARAGIVKAMAHPSRLMIVDELSKGKKCVADLTEMVGADVSTVSKHLSVLKDAGIITSQKKGQQVYYALRCTCIMNFFSCVETVLKIKAGESKKAL